MEPVRSITVKFLYQSQYEGGPFNFGSSYTDGSLNSVINSLLAIRESIPPEYRDKASCEISSESGYEGSHSAAIEVSYMRPETLDETAERERNDAAQKAEREAKERAAYEKLKRKFG